MEETAFRLSGTPSPTSECWTHREEFKWSSQQGASCPAALIDSKPIWAQASKGGLPHSSNPGLHRYEEGYFSRSLFRALDRCRRLEGYWALFVLLACRFLVDHFVFCPDEFHEGNKVLRASEAESSKGALAHLVSGPPVDRLILDYPSPGLLVRMNGCADLFSSSVDVEELSAAVVEGGYGLSRVFLVLDLHGYASELSHSGSEDLE